MPAVKADKAANLKDGCAESSAPQPRNKSQKETCCDLKRHNLRERCLHCGKRIQRQWELFSPPTLSSLLYNATEKRAQTHHQVGATYTRTTNRGGKKNYFVVHPDNPQERRKRHCQRRRLPPDLRHQTEEKVRHSGVQQHVPRLGLQTDGRTQQLQVRNLQGTRKPPKYTRTILDSTGERRWVGGEACKIGVERFKTLKNLSG